MWRTSATLCVWIRPIDTATAAARRSVVARGACVRPKKTRGGKRDPSVKNTLQRRRFTGFGVSIAYHKGVGLCFLRPVFFPRLTSPGRPSPYCIRVGSKDQVSVHFGCNPRPTDCFLTELSRTWPPPVLPDGLVVGDNVHYCGATNQWIHAGRTYRLEHGGLILFVLSFFGNVFVVVRDPMLFCIYSAWN